MSSISLFNGHDTLYVHAWGPGKLHLLSFSPVASTTGLSPTVGSKGGPNATGPTNFVVGFSHYFVNFALYWDGPEEAFLRIGTHSPLIPIGTSWQAATLAEYAVNTVVTADVSSVAATAINRDNATTIFVVPEF